jgi:cyclophilin family peptidyl-prolyl cis-trans isomerase
MALLRKEEDEESLKPSQRRGSSRRDERLAEMEARRRLKRQRLYGVIALVVALVVVGSAAGYYVVNRGDGDGGGGGGNPTAVIVTDYGTIEFELFMDVCPQTAGNFKKLANQGFFNGIVFHRVIQGFMIQGGDPTGTGTGGPGYEIPDEQSALELEHERGTVSMANSGPDTGGSQFFICVEPQHHLDGKHAVFGQVTRGMDVVDAISKVATDENDRPLSDVVMRSVTIG